jgi:hypothetical protein
MAQSPGSETVAWAGVSYFASAEDIEGRYPIISRIEAEASARGSNWDRDAVPIAREFAPATIQLSTELNPSSGSALMLVFTSERLEKTRIADGAWKQTFGVSGSLILVQAESRQIITAVPVSLYLIRSTRNEMSPGETDQWLTSEFDLSNPSGVFQQFFAQLERIPTGPSLGRCSVQVSQVTFADESLAEVPISLAADWSSTWSEMIASELSLAWARASPLVTLPPFTTRAVDGEMPARFSDGRVFNLKIPEPDYLLVVEGVRVAEAPYGSSASGTSRVFGSWGRVSMIEPLSGRVLVNAPLAEALVRRISATSSVNQERLPELSVVESLRSMINGGVTALFGSDRSWFRDRRIDSSINNQFSSLQNTLRRCS